MTKELVVQHTPLQFVMFGLFLFSCIFLGMFTWIFRTSSKKYEQVAHLPFEVGE